MSGLDSAIKDLIQAFKEFNKNKTSPYDTQAEVKRVEGNIAWVHIPGGVDETPVRMTVNAEVGDSVQVRVSGGDAFLVGNGTAPPTNDKKANQALANIKTVSDIADAAFMTLDEMRSAAEEAGTTLTQIYQDAVNAQESAEEAQESADRASESAGKANQSASLAQTSADAAQASADNAGEYASRALGNLSTVQSITETLNWITSHGTMMLTTDTQLDPSHVYFVADQNGDYVVGGQHYAVVTEPDVAGISTYYELSIDESLNNYVATHLAVDSEGLWIIPDAGGNKVLIATGSGGTYTTAGTYIVGSDNMVLASFMADGVRVGKIQDPHIEFGSTSSNFYGNNQALVGKITSGEEGISTYTNSAFVGSSTITGRGVINSVPKTLYDAELWYNPETDISVNYNIDGTDYTQTISKSTDSDQTVNGMRFKYTVATNKLLIQCVKTPFTLSYEVDSDTHYLNASDRKCATYDYNSTNKRGVLTLNYTPVSGTAIKVNEVIVGTFSFTAGTSQTLKKTSSGTTVTAVYNATNKTVTLTATGTVTNPVFDSATYTIKCADVGGVKLTFNRKYWKPQFSFGLDNTMNEYGFANAFGQGLIIGAEHQTVLGKYNTRQTNALFVIGKGSNSSTRSDAAVVTPIGNMTIAGRLTQSSDRRLKEHIAYLGEDADEFIRNLKPAYYIKDDAKHVGFYAQDVEEADKWGCMVGEMNGYKTLGYTELIAPLVAYCQHLEKRIEELEKG